MFYVVLKKILEWLFDEEDDPDFIPLCPEEIEANLPNGQMSFRVKPKSLLIKNSATGSKYLYRESSGFKNLLLSEIFSP